MYVSASFQNGYTDYFFVMILLFTEKMVFLGLYLSYFSSRCTDTASVILSQNTTEAVKLL